MQLLFYKAMHEQGHAIRYERKLLEDQLELLKKQKEPMDAIVADCKYLGKLSARRYVNSFAGIILAQYFFTQCVTYVAFSWDIIEPIACCMSMSDDFIAYVFWLNTGCPWDI